MLLKGLLHRIRSARKKVVDGYRILFIIQNFSVVFLDMLHKKRIYACNIQMQILMLRCSNTFLVLFSSALNKANVKKTWKKCVKFATKSMRLSITGTFQQLAKGCVKN
jgi:hypothetical protein